MTSISTISVPLVCKVCGDPSNQFNYGAITCNACKMFYRRQVAKSPLATERCAHPDKSHDVKDCRFCRYLKCLSVGMSLGVDTELSKVIKTLKILEAERKYHSLHSRSPDVQFTVSDAITNPIRFTDRGYKFQFKDWLSYNTLAGIHYLKRVDPILIQNLCPEDQLIIIREFTVKVCVFQDAKVAHSLKKGALQFADGTDCCPKNDFIDEKFENKIRFRLVGRLAELQVTDEEYLLLVMIFFCNPVLNGLTEPGRVILASYQNRYSSLLLQLCNLNHQQSGPTRFTDLLSLCHVVNQTFEDIRTHSLCCFLNRPLIRYASLVNETIK